ncbi:DarT ssDNA thymidine ADP-ribosyltransferase family protein [Raoultella sp. WB_B2P2-3]|uniref:DarT ssDNA thymidine ADP-ribosyltransferase family protein n=1 Tax=Raoultella scottii TaxID=3040937 RepID=A0ABU8ZBC4_9ENTR
MWTVIGILIVLAIIGNLIKKKETPPTKSGSQPVAPQAVVAKPEVRQRGAEPFREAAEQRNSLFNNREVVNKEKPALSREPDNVPVSITMTEALAIIMHVVGFKDYMLTRYAITGLTNLAPAYTSDLHYAFMQQIPGKPFYAIQQFNWARAIDFSQVKRRNISSLYHFTHLDNLKGIFSLGIMTRQQIENAGYSFHYNDELRLDGVRDSISLSVGHINNKMLYKYSQGLSHREWVILKIKKELISGPTQPSFDFSQLLNRAVFCRSNAASNAVKAVSVDERKKHTAFQTMFVGDNDEESGDRPYDIQAEILYLGNIPSGFISEVIFYSADNIPLWLRDSPVIITVDPSRFSFR